MEAHLPCPPLREWLPVLLGGRRVGVARGRTPRRIGGVLRDWPQLELGAEGRVRASDLAELDALMFGVQLDRPDPPEPCLELLRPGTLVIELGWPRARPVRRLLGLDGSESRRAKSGQARVLAWLARGYFAVEQWESTEPDEVLVTLARVR